MVKQPRKNIRRKILQTAEALFAQRGFDATGIDQIAKTAGITKSLIYYYFKSKEEILASLMDDFVKKSVVVKQSITEAWLAEPTLGIDTIILNNTLPFLMANKNAIKIAFAESIKDVELTPHLNIFRYFDQNFDAGYTISTRLGIRLEKNQAQLLSGFFCFFAPLFSFVIFSDEWCEYYNTDLETISTIFAISFGKIYSALTRDQIETLNLNEIMKSMSASHFKDLRK